MSCLIIVEHDNQDFAKSNLSVINACSKLQQPIDCLVAGFQCQQVVEQLATVSGLRTILVADAAVYQNPLAENLSKLITDISANYHYVVSAASTFGKDLMPRTAAMLGIEQISDISEIIDQHTFVRPIHAGNAYATVAIAETPIVLTIRSSCFSAAEFTAENAEIKTITNEVPPAATRFLSRQLQT